MLGWAVTLKVRDSTLEILLELSLFMPRSMTVVCVGRLRLLQSGTLGRLWIFLVNVVVRVCLRLFIVPGLLVPLRHLSVVESLVTLRVPRAFVLRCAG